MTFPKDILDKYVAELDSNGLQQIYRIADAEMMMIAESASDEFQIAAEIMDIFRKYSNRHTENLIAFGITE